MRLPRSYALGALALLLACGCGEGPSGDDCRLYCETLDACLEPDAASRPTLNLPVCLNDCEDLFRNAFEDDACGRAPGSFVSCAANIADTGTCTDVLRISRVPPAEGEERPCLAQSQRLGPCGLSVPASF